MEPMYYIGLDVHKKKVSYCVACRVSPLNRLGKGVQAPDAPVDSSQSPLISGCQC
jgi:hypothetical protein